MWLWNMNICVYDAVWIKFMDIKTYSKVDIRFWNITFKKIRSREGKKQMNSLMKYTFRFNIKSSLLKLLFTLARLFKGTPLQPLILNFFGIRDPRSLLPFILSLLVGRETRHKKAHKSHENDPIPNLPTPETSRTKPSTTYPAPR